MSQQHVCSKCGADAVTVSPDGLTMPKTSTVVIPGVTHCSDPACELSDPARADAEAFVPAAED